MMPHGMEIKQVYNLAKKEGDRSIQLLGTTVRDSEHSKTVGKHINCILVPIKSII